MIRRDGTISSACQRHDPAIAARERHGGIRWASLTIMGGVSLSNTAAQKTAHARMRRRFGHLPFGAYAWRRGEAAVTTQRDSGTAMPTEMPSTYAGEANAR